MTTATILAVDDEPDQLSLVRMWLEGDGYEVLTATNGWDALDYMVQHRPALTITDIRMPRMDGFQLISRIREISDSHVLALSLLGDDEYTIRGLELGADAFVTKPISKRMFLVQVRSLMRRAESPDEVPGTYDDDCLSLNLLTHDAHLHGAPLNLRPTEFRLLSFLARNQNRVVSHQELLDQVWGCEGGSLDSLKWYIASLRHKIKENCDDSGFILTSHRVGYRYQPSAPCPHFPADKEELVSSI